jgi:hypothetical protein
VKREGAHPPECRIAELRVARGVLTVSSMCESVNVVCEIYTDSLHMLHIPRGSVYWE